jgi:hypothetical protein
MFRQHPETVLELAENNEAPKLLQSTLILIENGTFPKEFRQLRLNMENRYKLPTIPDEESVRMLLDKTSIFEDNPNYLQVTLFLLEKNADLESYDELQKMIVDHYKIEPVTHDCDLCNGTFLRQEHLINEALHQIENQEKPDYLQLTLVLLSNMGSMKHFASLRKSMETKYKLETPK